VSGSPLLWRIRTSRRSALLAGGGLAAAGLAGCDLSTSPSPWHPAPDVLLPLLANTIKLADRYDATLTALPSLTARLTPLRDDHRAHVVALARELGLDENDPLASVAPGATVEPSASATGQHQDPTQNPSQGVPVASSIASAPADPAAAIAELIAAEKSAQPQAVSACLAAPSYRAALLGSIAACRASHLTALQ
jgi:hypothetical protein